MRATAGRRWALLPALLALGAVAGPALARPQALALAAGWGADAWVGRELSGRSAAMQPTGCHFATGAGPAARAVPPTLGASLSDECASDQRRVVDPQAGALTRLQSAWVDHLSLEPPGAQHPSLRSQAQPVSETGTWALMLSGVVGVLSLAHRRRPG